MTTPRVGHTATLLPNGKVLIAGGSGTASAELYDLSTGAFSATGDMTTPRVGHTATLLPNGKVLIAGGSGTASAELYDPTTWTFTATGDMTTGRSGVRATLLTNGKVLIAGGSAQEDHAELYDPDTGTFSLTGGTTYPHAVALCPRTSPMTASLLTNSKVLVTLQDACDPGAEAEVYDPATGTFAATGNMTQARGYSTGTLLPDGTVLIAGRDFVYPFGGSAELYDPVTGAFNTRVVMQREEGHTATLLPDGTVLMSGGWVCCGYSLDSAEIYHPAVLTPAPLLLSLSRDGRGQAAILHPGTAQVVSSSSPAVAGEALEIYCTGLIDGSVIPPQVAIGGRIAEILFFGTAPGYPGLNQVNVRVPRGVTPGPAVPVRLTYLGRPSNEVTIGVQ